jgi:hypothetical protein
MHQDGMGTLDDMMKRLAARRKAVLSTYTVRSTSRVPSGIWNMSVATFDGTALKFQPSVYDNLEPFGRPTTFSALGATCTEPMKIKRKEQKYLTHQGFQAIRRATDKGGDVEVAGRTRGFLRRFPAWPVAGLMQPAGQRRNRRS